MSNECVRLYALDEDTRQDAPADDIIKEMMIYSDNQSNKIDSAMLHYLIQDILLITK